MVEEDHQCLKTGCRIEDHLLQSVAHLLRLLGLLAPVAVRLKQLRDLAREAPERLACEAVEAEMLAVVAAQTHQVACADDDRRSLAGSGAPGWVSGSPARWAAGLEDPVEGGAYGQTLLEGVHLATDLPL